MKGNEMKRNASGYYDPTAFHAICDYMKGEKEMKSQMAVYKGDICLAKLNNGSEREFVVLSVHDTFSTVLMLGNGDNLPYPVKCKTMMHTNPGMLQYMFNDRFISFIRSMTDKEIDDLMKAVADSLGIDAVEASAPSEVVQAEAPKEVVKEVIVSDPEIETLKAELTKSQAERDVFKGLYENLISKMMAK